MRQTTAKLGTRQFHQWLIPEKTVVGIFSLGVILVFIGAILLGLSSIASGALAIIGGILLAVGLILIFLCVCLCVHAWCVWYVRDAETQTIQTAVLSSDQTDGEWYSSYGVSEVKTPNGVLRDSRQPSSLSKKHVTISPGAPGQYSDGYMAGGRRTDTPVQKKSGPGSVTSDMSTLASFAYLNDPSMSTPYSTMGEKQRQGQGQGRQVPIHVQSNYDYNSIPRGGEAGRTVQVRPYQGEQGTMGRSNVLPVRRHSDDDYDNASDMTPMLPYQTFQPVPQNQQAWQHHQQQQQQQQQHYQQQQQNAQWQKSTSWQRAQPPPQQTVWQYQHQPQPTQTWRSQQIEEPPPAQPLVHPSARRPMTFEQISSSKVSLYDNIHMNRQHSDEE